MTPVDNKEYIKEMTEELAEEYWEEDQEVGVSKYDIEDLWRDEQEISYSLSKQLSSMKCIHTDYGNIPLDAEMTDIIEAALRKLLEKRLSDVGRQYSLTSYSKV